MSKKPKGYGEQPDPIEGGVFDNHTHLDFDFDVAELEQYSPEEALDHAATSGVLGVVQVGTDLATSRWSASLAQRDRRVLAAVALHPNDVPQLALDGVLDEHIAGIAELAAQPRVRAVGETGLDYFRTEDDAGRDVQEQSFREHIRIAASNDVAMQIHDRDAHDDVLRVLDSEPQLPPFVVLHCFSGDADFARACLERGFWLSFAGNVTYPANQHLRDAALLAPAERILVETDAPFLTPVPHRGRPNSPFEVTRTARFLAELRTTDEAEFAASVRRNTTTVYGAWS